MIRKHIKRKKTNSSLDRNISIEENLSHHDLSLSPFVTKALHHIFKNQDTIPSHPKISTPKEKSDLVTGHRSRLKQKFMKYGSESLHDYEFLELILFTALPRRDVKPLAKQLLAHFHDLATLVSTSEQELRHFSGIGDSVLFIFKLLKESTTILLKHDIKQQTILSSWSKVCDYVRLTLGRLTHEEFHVLFLDTKNKLITDECLSKGTIDKAIIYPREIVKRALELCAKNIILVHNHPSGDTTPSGADIALTNKIIDATKILDITVMDHLIVGVNDVTSFRNLGLL